jgi:uncharacterized protein YjbI with pentapeptide repeats
MEAPLVRINHVRMTGTKLIGLHCTGWIANRWQGRGVLLRGTRLEKAELHHCDITNSQGQELHWPASKLFDSRFVETPLTNANFGRSVMVGCEFAQSDLNHANLTESLLLGCRFTDARQGGAVLDNINLSGAVLCNVDLRGANLFRASFANAVLVGVDLRESNLTGVSFRNAVIVDVKTDRADLAGSTHQEFHAAGTSMMEAFERLRHLSPDVTAMIAAALLLRSPGATTAPTAGSSAGASSAADPLASLMRLNFAAMIRELQGRGGPQELGQLRVDGDHVYARSVTGEEVRLTSAQAAPARVAPQMRAPEPGASPSSGNSPSAPSRPAAPAAAPAPTSSAGGRFSGLEID